MARLQVLVVEDDPVWRNDFKTDIERALQRTGQAAEVCTRESYQEGIDALNDAPKESPWDLLVTDVGLPPNRRQKLGLRLAEEARRRKVPCIVVSNPSIVGIQEAVDCVVKFKACDFLSKEDWDGDRFANRVREILQPGSQPQEPPDTKPLGRMTIVVLDMLGFSAASRQLQQSIGPTATGKLIDQIQGFVTRALGFLGLTPSAVVQMTGDGAILAFDRASQAHWFAEAFHSVTWEHNSDRTEDLAKRRFRMGAATGETTTVSNADGPPQFAGDPISIATRLEQAGIPGGLLIDAATFSLLPKALNDKYEAVKLVKGKPHDPSFQARQYLIVPEAAQRPGEVTVSPDRLGGLLASSVDPGLAGELNPFPQRSPAGPLILGAVGTVPEDDQRRLESLALGLIGTEHAVRTWFDLPSADLGNQTPRQVLASGNFPLVEWLIRSSMNGNFG